MHIHTGDEPSALRRRSTKPANTGWRQQFEAARSKSDDSKRQKIEHALDLTKKVFSGSQVSNTKEREGGGDKEGGSGAFVSVSVSVSVCLCVCVSVCLSVSLSLSLSLLFLPFVLVLFCLSQI